MRDEFRETFNQELTQHPEITAEFVRRSKHRQVVLQFNGRRLSMFYPSSTSDYRARLNALSQLRRSIRELEDAPPR